MPSRGSTRCSDGVAIVGFPYAVGKRYAEDHGGWLGSLISYYGFFSLYPLLVVFVTVATWIFGDRPRNAAADPRGAVVEGAVHDRRVSPPRSTSRSLRSEDRPGCSSLSLIVTLWGGIGVVRVLQDTVNTIWGVPRYRRPRFLSKVARGLVILALLGLGIIGTAVVAGVTLAVDLPILAAVSTAVANIALAAAIAIVVYRLVIGAPVRTAELLPGAVITGVGAYAITLVGGLYVQHVIARMTGVYGPFASTIGLLAYVSLIVQVFVFGTEVNVVRAKHLWPRAMTPELGPADRRAIELTMRREALADPSADPVDR